MIVGSWSDPPDVPPTPARVERRRRDAYLGLWVLRPARDALDVLAAERGISRSEMARTVFSAGLLALGVDVAALRADGK